MYSVYLLAGKPYGTLYIGITYDLAQRVSQHKGKLVRGFTAKYGVDRLAWFEMHEKHASALQREKRIKGRKRDWKINLIERNNPHWLDLSNDLAA
jgi:putative endonuclease